MGKLGRTEGATAHPCTSIALESMEATRDELVRRGFRRVILLGDESVMQDACFKGLLAKAGLMVLTPGPDDRAWLGQVMAEGLLPGALRDETVERFSRLLADGAEHGVDALVLGCVVLAPLVARAGLDLPVVEVIQTHMDVLTNDVAPEGELA